MTAGQGESSAQGAARERPNYGATGLYKTIEHLELSAVTPTAIITFREARETYLRRIASKNRETGVDIKPVELKDSIPISRLRSLIFMKMIPAETVEEVTNDMIEAYLTEYSKRAGPVIETKSVDKALKSVKMDLDISDARGRVMSLVDTYLQALQDHGFDNYVETHIESAIRHIHSRLRPVALKARLELDCRLQPELRKRSFHDYVTRVVERAVACDAYSDPNLSVIIEDLKKDKGKEKASKSQIGKKDQNPKKRKFDRKDETPICLYEPCKKKGYRHYLKDCRACPEHEKQKLLQDYRDKKKSPFPGKKIRKVEVQGEDEVNTVNLRELVEIDNETSQGDSS